MTFGFFTRYLEGPVRNPAIACSSAVIISTLIVLIMIMIQKKTEKISQP
jgi:sodium/pantothenate symporter